MRFSYGTNKNQPDEFDTKWEYRMEDVMLPSGKVVTREVTYCTIRNFTTNEITTARLVMRPTDNWDKEYARKTSFSKALGLLIPRDDVESRREVWEIYRHQTKVPRWK